MDLKEYNSISTLRYLPYCDYLQAKYGIGLADYMTKSFSSNPKCKRTKDGLLAHHKMENQMILLSTKEIAMECPFEWQSKENIVYCDYLEHLLLHILICEDSKMIPVNGVLVGVGGVLNFLVPELNDYYSGWKTKQEWRKRCHAKIEKDKDVYMTLLRRFISENIKRPDFDILILFSSFNEQFGLWRKENNMDIYRNIYSIWKEEKKKQENKEKNKWT